MKGIPAPSGASLPPPQGRAHARQPRTTLSILLPNLYQGPHGKGAPRDASQPQFLGAANTAREIRSSIRVPFLTCLQINNQIIHFPSYPIPSVAPGLTDNHTRAASPRRHCHNLCICVGGYCVFMQKSFEQIGQPNANHIADSQPFPRVFISLGGGLFEQFISLVIITAATYS